MGGIAHHTAVGMTLVCSKAALGCWANRSHLTAQCEKEPQRKGPGETGEEMLRQASQAFFFFLQHHQQDKRDGTIGGRDTSRRGGSQAADSGFLLMMCYYISQDFIASDQSSSNGPK